MARVIKTVYELITKLTGNGLEKANAAAQVGESAFKKFAGAVKFTHSALEVAEKIGRAFEKVMKVTVDRALEYRGANDAAVQSITAFGDRLEESGARVGDFFVPALAGASEILEKLSKKFNAWATANRELVQSGVIEWAVKLATALASGVAVGVETVIKAWSGWQMLISTTEAAYERMSAAATKNNADERRAQGFTEEADRLDKLAEKHERLAVVADGAAAQAMTAMNARLSATQGFYDPVITEINRAGEAAIQMVGKSADFTSDKMRKLAHEALEIARKTEALLQRLGEEQLAQDRAESERIEAKRQILARFNEEQYAWAEKMKASRRADAQHQNDEQQKWSGLWQKFNEQNEKRRKEFWDRYGESIEMAQSATTSLFQGISQGFIDAAIDGKNFGDTMLSVIRSIAEELLKTAITRGVGAIFGSVVGGLLGGPAGAAAGGAAGSAIGGAVSSGGSGLSTGRSALRAAPTIVNHFEGPKSFLPVGLAEQQRIWRRHADTIQHQASRNR